MNDTLELKESEGLKIVGKYKFTLAHLETPDQIAFAEEIARQRQRGANVMAMVRQLNMMCRTTIYEHKNIIPMVARAMIINNLVDSTPTDTPILINYSALGTGATAPSDGQTQLVSESYRRAIASYSQNNDVGFVTAFYSALEITGTFTEHAIFSNGTSTANSGVMFSRTLINNGLGLVKTTSNTLTIDYTIELT